MLDATSRRPWFLIAMLLVVMVGFPLNGSYALSGSPPATPGIHRVALVLDGVIVGGFKEVDVNAPQEISVACLSALPPASLSVTLRRGFLSGPELSDWYQKGAADRKSGSVILLADDGVQEIGRYNFYTAWPCRWKGPALHSVGDTHTVEEIELAVERWEQA